MRPCCPRCVRPTERLDVDEPVTHYRCRHDDCDRPYPIYHGEHPSASGHCSSSSSRSSLPSSSGAFAAPHVDVQPGYGQKISNASTYRLNREHPATQMLEILDQGLRFGRTSMLLDERFVGAPGDDYEPGEHSAGPRQTTPSTRQACALLPSRPPTPTVSD